MTHDINNIRPVDARTPADRVRQVCVAAGSALAIAGAAWGSGAWSGTPIEEAADGALAADATLLAPASPAFGVWSVIYIALAAFAVLQALPSRANDRRMRTVSWLILVSMVLNAAWIAVVQAGWLWASVVVLATLVAVLGIIAKRLVAIPTSDAWGTAVTELAVGAYLGWSSVALAANVTAAGSASLDAQPADGIGYAIAVCVVVTMLAVVIARALRTHPWLSIATGLAITWGLAWIAVGRATGEPESLAIMWAAGLSAAIAFSATFAAIDFDPARRIES